MTFTSETVCSLNPFIYNQRQQQLNHNNSKMIIQQQQQQQQQQQNQLNQVTIQKQSTTNNAPDPVYLEDDEVFYNLIVKESSEQDCKQSRCQTGPSQQQLIGQQRHLLLSWMLRVCEHEYCEDDIFSLATMILDKFLLFKPIDSSNEQQRSCFDRRRRIRIKKVRKKPFMMVDIYQEENQQQQQQHIESFYCNEYNSNNNISTPMSDYCSKSSNSSQFDSSSSRREETAAAHEEGRDDEDEDEEETIDFDVRDEELRQRQLYLFAACSLLLASKLRQTPRLCIQILIEFSKLELPLELTRDEILDGELLILSSLKWDLGSLVTPNDFLTLILRKCRPLLEPIGDNQQSMKTTTTTTATAPHSRHYHHLSSSLSIDEDNLHTTQRLIGKQTTTTIVVVPARSALVVPEETPSALITPNSTPDEMIDFQRQHRRQRQRSASSPSLASPSATTTTISTTAAAATRCDEFKVKRHTQTLLELCLMDSQLSKYSPSILAMASMAVAIDGLSSWEEGLAASSNCARLNQILKRVHEATHKVNELKLMIDVAHQIEKYVQKLLNSARND